MKVILASLWCNDFVRVHIRLTSFSLMKANDNELTLMNKNTIVRDTS